MDFRFTPEQEAFRREVRAYLDEIGPMPGTGFVDPGEDTERVHAIERALCRKGWTTMAWPVEYGGQAADPVKQMLFREECAVAGAPTDQGATIVAPAIMIHGTEEQKHRFLPAIAQAEIFWCQGFSEPGSGSDLASLQTRATRDGDDYVINGQKIWTSGAYMADWIHVLARTDPDAPKHRGISYFVCDMNTPGITVRRLPHMTGRAHLCETFFDNVRVPASQMLGPENRGWYVALTTLDFERSGIDRIVHAQRILNDIAALAREPRWDDGRVADLPGVRGRMADLTISIEVGRWLAYRVAWMQAKGLVPNHEASISKVYGSEVVQKTANVGTYILGLYGQLGEGSRWAPLAGRIAFHYLHAVQATILAGTSEIQRNIIATRGLGLPRG